MLEKKGSFPLYLIATFIFGLKTYIVYRFMFNIELDNGMQEFILFINPFISAFLIFSISVWFKKPEKQMKFLRYSLLIMSFIVFANLVFYRQFTDFITIPQLFMASNMSDLGSSILTLIKPYDLLLFADVILVWRLSKKHTETFTVNHLKRGKVFVTTISLLLLSANLILAEIERPQLFTRAFDREYLVKNIGLFNYHVYDFVVHSKTGSQRVFADGDELSYIEDYVNENVEIDQEDNELFGIAKDKNVIFINAESIQEFIIGNQVNGEEVTPFLNSLIEDEDTYYFENFYEQTGQGNTSDSEFLVETSLYPLSRGAVFFTHGGNEYHSLAKIIKEEGYRSAVLHANNKSFWNRDGMYKSLGIDDFFGEESYEITEENSIGWGLKDKPYFEQSIAYLEEMPEPYYAKFITLTNHFPFEIGEEDKSIEPYDSNSNTLNNYFPAARYADEAMEEFFNHLKEAGIYDDSIIIIMGDHIGISANHNRAMSMYLDKEEITPYDQVQLLRVPLYIHIPGHGEGEVVSKVAGQIDLKPTILNLLGIESDSDILFGNDLFDEKRKGYIGLRNGDFISEDYVSTVGLCYDRETGELLESEVAEITESDERLENPSVCDEISNKVSFELSYSDSLIYGDLFRFSDVTKDE